MTDILVERRWPQPLTEADMDAMMAAAEGCMGIHRITWHGSLLSSDGLELLCHFRGPDAESVRIAMQQLGSPPGKVWPCRTQDAPGSDAADLARVNVAVSQSFDAPVEFDSRQTLDGADVGCLQLHRVRIVRRYLSLDRLRMVSLYQAPDAGSVRLAQPQDGMTSGRVWAVRRYAP
jgi:hypothetical protein